MGASASKSKTLTSSNGHNYTLTASFTENSTNTANNTSSIKVTATLKSTNSSWSSSSNSTLIIYWHDNRENRDRQVASVNITSLGIGASKSASGTINVTHKDDGTLSGHAYAKFTKGGTSAWTPASSSVSTNNTALTTIPRASQPTVSPSTFNIGDTITIKTNRKSTAFTHTITLYFGNYSYRIATGVTDTVTFNTSNIASQMYEQIPNASVGVGNVTAITYNGSTNIGSKNVLFNAKVTNSSPTFNTAYLDTNSTTTAITNNNQQIIRNNSTLQVNVTNAEAKNYATLSRATVVLNGTTYNANINNASATFNIGTVNLSSDTTAVVSVIDSRGISTSQNLPITVLDWVLPTAIINLQRENNFYSETNINVNAEYSSLDNKNTISIKARYKKVSDETYSSYTTLQDDVTSQFTLDNNYAWNVQVLLEDKIGSTTYNLVLDRGIPIAFFDRLKRSVGINCFPADNESLEVDDENILTRIAGYGQGANQVTGDWNTACGEASGYYMGNGLTNSPSGSTVDGWWWVVHIVHNDKYQRQIAYSFLSNEEVYTRIQNNGTWNSWTKVSGGGSSGTSDYTALTNKPSINGVTLSGNKTASDIGINVPTKVSDLTNDVGYIDNSVNNLAYYTKSSDLHAVATSGDYEDLSNKPTVNDATLTIQKNGTTVDTFTANSSEDTTVNIEVPTKTSDLTNDSGYITTNNDIQINGTSIVSNNVANIKTKTAYNSSTNKIATMSDVPSNLKNGSGNSSLAQTSCTSSDAYSFAEGYSTTASGQQSHAEGTGTIASGTFSHAEGYNAVASALSSHAEGWNTEAGSPYQHVQGRYNIIDNSDVYADIVGNGSSDNWRSNAYTLDWSGNGVFAGKVTAGANPTANMDLTTKQYVDNAIPTKTSDLTNDSGYIDNTYHDSSKQDTLVSGTSIKTINNQSLLGSGNISISGGGGTATDVQINGTSITNNDVANIVTEGSYNASTNKIATMSDVPTDTSDLTNGAGYIATETDPVFTASASAGITSSDITNWDTNTTNIGDLSNLQTTAKSDLVSSINEVSGKIEDTGWINLTTAKGTWNYFRCRKIGKVVHIQGRASAYAWGGSAENIVTIPAGLRPAEALYTYGFTSGYRIDRWYINTSGTMGVDYSINISNGSNYTTSNWHSVNITYMID